MPSCGVQQLSSTWDFSPRHSIELAQITTCTEPSGKPLPWFHWSWLAAGGMERPSVTQRVGAACAIRALPDLCGGIVPGLSFTLRLSGCTELGGKCGVGQSVTTRTAKAALWQAPARR